MNYAHPWRFGRSRSLLLATLAALLFAAPSAMAAAQQPKPAGSDNLVFIPATDPAFTYIGRWGELSTGTGVAMATVNSSSQAYIAFSGSVAYGDFDVRHVSFMAQIAVRVDDGPWRLITIDRPQIQLCAQLSKGTHQLEIAIKDVDERGNRWFPPFASAVVFEGLEIAPQAILSAVSLPPAPTLAFLGDSITQGVRVMGMQIGVTGSNALESYAWLAGEELHTRHYQVAFGRQGVLRTGNGDVPPATLAFGWNFAGSPANEPAPDFLVLNQGTNDQRYPPREYLQGLLGYLKEIRAYYPHTVIFVLRPFGGFHSASTQQAVMLMHDPRIHYVDTTNWLKPSDYRDGVHPNRRGSEIAAQKLEAVLSPYIKAWKTQP